MLQKVKAAGLMILLAFASCKSSRNSYSQKPEPAEVQVLATIHNFHATNPNYPYSKVTQLIQKFHPDLIAVEIRPEDLKGDTAYLAQFYPREMRQVLLDFPREKVRGVDWYGNEMAGKKMPADVFKNEQTELGKMKSLGGKMHDDPQMKPKLLPLEELGNQQEELAKNSSPAMLNNGHYDQLTVTFYEVLEAAVQGTQYVAYTNFNRERDVKITDNIVKLAKANPGKRIIVLLGANHRARAVKALESMPETVKLVPVMD
jgi:hypothetical protein